jgi:hypothetical protein
MGTYVTYGLGGYCAECDPSHDHPLHNIVAQGEYESEEPQTDIQALAEALAELPEETLNALKQALGL